MEEPVRLACPQCELLYRLKRYTPGKAYACKNCGGPLVQADGLAVGGGGENASAHAHASSRSFFDGSGHAAGGGGGGSAEEGGVVRLQDLLEELRERLDDLKDLDAARNESESAARFLELNEKLDADLHEFKEALESRLAELGEMVAGDVRGDREEMDSLRNGLTAMDSRLSTAIDEKFRELRIELGDRLGDLSEGVRGIAAKAQPEAFFATGLDGLRQELGVSQERKLDAFAQLQKQGLEAIREAQQREFEALRTVQQKEFDAGREQLRQTLATHLEAQKNDWLSYQKDQKRAIDALLAPPEEGSIPGGATVEVNIDELADRLVAGLRSNQSKFVDPEAGLAVDTMSRLAEGLVREQSANTEKLNSLAKAVNQAAAGISNLEEWRSVLPERVADEIGRTIEERVVGPVSGALAKQAPSILSDLQDNKLVDIVSRSVREAQRPLLREVLSSNRGGIPLWLFASILLPLLLILGYLFLPGEVGGGRRDESLDEVSERLARIEAGMGIEGDERLGVIEETVLDIHAEAMAHVRNAAALEAENGNLKAMLAERDQLMNEYKQTLQTQVKRLREYEMRLVQLGVSPKSVSE